MNITHIDAPAGACYTPFAPVIVTNQGCADNCFVGVSLSMEEKILTRHPAGKQGVNISRPKYHTVREAIIEALCAY